jgi:hypothetical protein
MAGRESELRKQLRGSIRVLGRAAGSSCVAAGELLGGMARLRGTERELGKKKAMALSSFHNNKKIKR